MQVYQIDKLDKSSENQRDVGEIALLGGSIGRQTEFIVKYLYLITNTQLKML